MPHIDSTLILPNISSPAIVPCRTRQEGDCSHTILAYTILSQPMSGYEKTADLNGVNPIVVNRSELDGPSTNSSSSPGLIPGRLWQYLLVCVLFLLLQIFTRSPNL